MKYTVIDKEEPYGQSVSENEIPCTAKYCAAELNRLIQENHRMSVMIEEFNKLLNDLFNKLNNAKASSKREIDIACAYAQLRLIAEIIDEAERIKYEN